MNERRDPFFRVLRLFLWSAVPDAEITPTLPRAVASVATIHLALSIDTALYLLFGLVALGLRLIQLGSIVLNDSEAHEALAVFRVIDPNAVGTQLATHQPLMFAANTLMMAIGGSNNFTARLATALVGMIIVFMPLLYRRWIGRAGSLIASGALALSPVLLVSSRTMAGPVWTIALALGAVWLTGRFVETRRAVYAVIASALFGLMLFASEGPGFLVGIMLLVGLAFAVATGDDSAQNGTAIRQTITSWPWLRALLVSALTLVVVGTVFFLHPQGLSAVGDTIGRGLNGFLFRQAENPVAFPLLASLLYEPVLWLFGLVGAWLVLREGGSFLQRGLIGWLVAGIVACLVYPGAGAEHALWLTIPLVGLAAYVIERILTPIRDQFWTIPVWGPWLHGVGVVAVLSIAAINLLLVGHQILNTAPSLTPSLNEPYRLVLVGLTFALVVILYFLVGSVWGGRAAWHGLGIGVLVFLGIYSVSNGWRAAVVNADDPRELWRTRAVSQNLQILSSTLVETSLRAVGMPYDMPLTVVGSDDGALAWLVRAYSHTSFVQQPSDAINGPAAILPADDSKPPLGAASVGEPFTLYSTWDRSSMQDWDFIAWLYDRGSRVLPVPESRITLWVRADVYGASGIPGDTGLATGQSTSN